MRYLFTFLYILFFNSNLDASERIAALASSMSVFFFISVLVNIVLIVLLLKKKSRQSQV